MGKLDLVNTDKLGLCVTFDTSERLAISRERPHSTGVESTTHTSSVHSVVSAANARMTRRTRPGTAPQPLVVTGLLGQVGEQVSQPGAGVPQPAGLGGEPAQGLHHRQGDQLGVGELGGDADRRAGRRPFGRRLSAGHRSSRTVRSRGCPDRRPPGLQARRWVSSADLGHSSRIHSSRHAHTPTTAWNRSSSGSADKIVTNCGSGSDPDPRIAVSRVGSVELVRRTDPTQRRMRLDRVVSRECVVAGHTEDMLDAEPAHSLGGAAGARDGPRRIRRPWDSGRSSAIPLGASGPGVSLKKHRLLRSNPFRADEFVVLVERHHLVVHADRRAVLLQVRGPPL